MNQKTKDLLETAAHVAGVLALIISSLNVYYAYFDGPDLYIRSFSPLHSEINKYNTENDIFFTFELYNDGSKPAFVSNVFPNRLMPSSKKELYSGVQIEPCHGFYVDAGSHRQINVTIPAPHAKIATEIMFEIYQEEPFELIESKIITVTWN